MTAPLVLGIDTSTTVNVGVARGRDVLAAGTVDDRMAHVEQLTPLVRRVLTEAGLVVADLERIVVGLGPGPFTGLRVGIATARMLASVTGVPLRAVCSLDVVAVQYAQEQPGHDFVVVTDARRRELYWASYDPDGARLDGPGVALPDEVPSLPAVGPGADLYPDSLDAVLGPRTVDPGVLAREGLRLSDAGTEPLYLRRPDTSAPSRRKSVLARRLDRPRR